MHIKKNISLKKLNTFGLEATASTFIEINSIEDFKEALQNHEVKNSKLLILGGGSNILLTKDFDGVVLKNNIKGIEVIDETDDDVLVKAGGGENWHNFVVHCISQGWAGIENLSLIPGTVGAAPMQNIGAYGREIKDVFESLNAINIQTGEIKTFNNKDCHFGYRESVFKNVHKDEFFIAEVVFKLSKRNHKLYLEYGAIQNTLEELKIKDPSIKDVSDAVIAIRQSKLPDPKEIGNSGSFFKNPSINKVAFESLKVDYPNIPGYELPENLVKVPAGWLIEQAGWKGYSKNNIGVHDKQALVLVNRGGGNGKEIAALAEEIKQSVIKKFGIELSAEVNFI